MTRPCFLQNFVKTHSLLILPFCIECNPDTADSNPHAVLVYDQNIQGA
eukprot:CAMPEP_0114027390 /NCGR_PEP_ID=MMETSP1159-20121227/2624_1 /TAXON_ID=88271 /ORGANISM="Picocystis salinarum" /LENGTH=47 /assembly_acc=CAM_ASM_000767